MTFEFYYDKDLDDISAHLFYLRCIVQHFCVLGTLAWLVYEYCITLDKEIEFFWGRRPNGGSLLFFFGRYLPFVVGGVAIRGFTITDEQRYFLSARMEDCCYKLAFAYRIVASMQYLPHAACASVRVWVVGGRSWALTTFVAVLSLAPIGMAYVSPVEVTADPSFGCIAGLISIKRLEEERCQLVVASRVCLMTSDAIVLVATCLAAYNMGLLQWTSQWKYTSFWKTLFRDGTIHFCALFVSNMVSLVISFRLTKRRGLNTMSYVAVPSGLTTIILVNRFLIHIQEVNKRITNGLSPSGDAFTQCNNSSLELRFIKTYQQTVIITRASNIE